jgi:predicted nucleic acid-binding protein
LINTFVVDASVVIKLFIVEESSEKATQLFLQLEEDPESRFYVPELVYAECANILWKYARRYNYPVENARQDLIDLRALALQSIPIRDLLLPTIDLALQYGISAYDACYLALAQELKVPLVTADNRLVKRVQGSNLPIHILEEL